MFKLYILFAFTVLSVRCAENVKIPNWLVLCPRNDDIDDCLKESIQKALPHLADGVPEFGMPSLDPYLLKEMKVEYKRNQISARAKFSNALIKGVSKSKVKGVRTRFNDEKIKIEVDLYTPAIEVECDFKIEGRIQALRVNGKGYGNSTMSDLTYTWRITGDIETKEDGKEYIKMTDFWMRPDVGEMKLYLSDLFPGNPELSRLGMTLANQYWRLIYGELLPYVETFWNEIGVTEANRIFQKLPLDVVFAEEA